MNNAVKFSQLNKVLDIVFFLNVQKISLLPNYWGGVSQFSSPECSPENICSFQTPFSLKSKCICLKGKTIQIFDKGRQFADKRFKAMLLISVLQAILKETAEWVVHALLKLGPCINLIDNNSNKKFRKVKDKSYDKNLKSTKFCCH